MSIAIQGHWSRSTETGGLKPTESQRQKRKTSIHHFFVELAGVSPVFSKFHNPTIDRQPISSKQYNFTTSLQ